MHLAPIVLFVYNRPDHTARTLEYLSKNEEAKDSLLYIFCDGPKENVSEEQLQKIAATRKIIRQQKWCGEVKIIESTENKGLAKSVISGVTEVVNNHGTVIVLEDDLLVSPFFLKYMNDGLNFYQDKEQVISIHGYVYPVQEALPETFFIKGADCWGWATWKRGWDLLETDGKELLNILRLKNLTREFDFNNSYGYTRMLRKHIAGKNNSWAILWYASAFLKNKLTLYPGRSLVSNIGNDGLGTNTSKTNVYSVELSDDPVEIKTIPLQHDERVAKYFENYFRSIKPSLFASVMQKLKLSPAIH